MFEKEAEEYYKDVTVGTFQECEENFADAVLTAYRDGAEYGYNKAYEWHSYAERPKERLNALCFDSAQNQFILGYYDIESDEWIKYGGYETITIDMWKKIVPPNLRRRLSND